MRLFKSLSSKRAMIIGSSVTLGVLLVGGVAFAGELLPAGEYTIALPGPDITFTVSETGGITLGALPDGLTAQIEDDGVEISGYVSVEIESDGIKIGDDDGTGLAAGETVSVTLPDGSTLTFAADGTFTLPVGWTIVVDDSDHESDDEDGNEIVITNGTLTLKVEFEDGELKISVVEADDVKSDDDESDDDESDDDESDDDESDDDDDHDDDDDEDEDDD